MKKEDFLGFDYKVSVVKKSSTYAEFEQMCKEENPECLFGRSRDGKTETCYTCDNWNDDIERRYIYEYKTGNIYKVLERVF